MHHFRRRGSRTILVAAMFAFTGITAYFVGCGTEVGTSGCIPTPTPTPTPTPNPNPEDPTCDFTDILVTPESIYLASIGETAQLSVIGKRSDCDDVNLTSAASGTSYSSSDPAVASVSMYGLVTAVKIGTAVITVSNEGLSTTVDVSVATAGCSLTGLVVVPEQLSFSELGQTTQLTVTGQHSNCPDINLTSADSGTTYSSDAPSVASVSVEGLVAALSGGTATIKVSNAERSKEVSVTVTLAPVLVGLVVEPNTIVFASTTQSQPLLVKGVMSDGSEVDLTSITTGTTYESSSESIATVSAGGLVRPIANGSTSIVVANNGMEALVDVGVDVLTTITQSAPYSGEGEVNVLRETVIDFLNPVQAVPDGAVSAVAAAKPVATHMVLSTNKKRLFVFYSEQLPGNTEVTVTLDGSQIIDSAGRMVDADGDDQPGGNFQISYTTLSLTPILGTRVMGTIYDSELLPDGMNTPLEGVRISIEGLPSVFAVTDNMGNYTLGDTPAGTFFVLIDGATEVGSQGMNGPLPYFYPTLGKPFPGVRAGQENVMPNIYLPKVMKADLQQGIDPTQEIVIHSSDPRLAGIEVRVPANSLFREDGQSATFVGVGAVPPNRLPGPLPGGVGPPVVFTFQTDGTNLMAPASVKFPNLENLSPGTKSALMSFNHDSGKFEFAGTMTTDETGHFHVTDSGAGIPAPGWHWVGPAPIQSPPPPPPCKPSETCCYDDYPPTGGCGDLQSTPNLRDFPECSNPCSSGCELQNHPCDTAQDVACLILRRRERDLKLAQCDRSEWDCLSLDILNMIQCFIRQPEECYQNVRDEYETQRCECHRNHCMPSWKTSCCNTNLNALTLDPEPDPDPIVNQLRDLKNQIWVIVSPYLGTAGLPPSVVTSVQSLVNEANTISGGSASEYLEGIVRSRSTDLTYLIVTDQPRGTLPPRVLKYAAVLQGSSGRTIIRDETDPRGLYTLFPATLTQLESVSFFDTSTGQVGNVLPKLSSRRDEVLSRPYLNANSSGDYDSDGLVDLAEFVLGTNQYEADTDCDGIPDGQEIQASTDPLCGVNGLNCNGDACGTAATGIVAAIDTPGFAHEVCVKDDRAIVADGDAGISVFNVFQTQSPVLVARVDTPGTAVDVDCEGNFIAVADVAAGLAIVDISTPNAASIVHQVALPSSAQARSVSVVLGIAYVGDSFGRVHLIELSSGVLLGSLTLNASNSVDDLGVSNQSLFALTTANSGTGGTLYALTLTPGLPGVAGQIAANHLNVRSGPFPRRRLSAGLGRVLVSGFGGIASFNTQNPAAMTPGCNNGQLFSRGIVENGSGNFVLAAAGGSGSNMECWVYNDFPISCSSLLTQYTTPGDTHGIGLNNGLAFLADGNAGLQIVNIISTDVQGNPPTGTLSVSAIPSGDVTEGGRVRILADVADDVQMRNVEFRVNGQWVNVDGNYPFEFYWQVPAGSAGQVVTFSATARDSGGNPLELGPIEQTIVADTQPPTVTITSPANDATYLRGDDLIVTLTATDNVRVASFAFQIDGSPVTAIRTSLNTWLLPLPSALGVYNLSASVTDTANLVGNSQVINFRVTHEAISRELSVFAGKPPLQHLEAISREVSVFAGKPPLQYSDAISREVSVYVGP